MKLVVVVLTFNEELHLERCLKNIKLLTDHIIVVDSFSTDNTKKIAKSFNVTFYQNEFINQAQQFNWVLKKMPDDTNWILRIDADEYLSNELIKNISKNIRSNTKINGYSFKRFICFQDKILKYGGLSKIKVVRLFRFGYGKSEERFMDEHIKVTGKISNLAGEIIDHNLNTLTFWIDKHNNYASREALDILNREFNFKKIDSISNQILYQTGLKRWIKENIYLSLPLFLRPLLYFLYRYIFRLGLLDGKAGLTFHFFQAFWYRYLVDEKVLEVKKYCKKNDIHIKKAIKEILRFEL